MDSANKEYIETLLNAENEELRKLQEIVVESLKEEELISNSLHSIYTEDLSFAQRASDAIASFVGSWFFIISFTFVVLAWISINGIWLTHKAFDPYPFILLNLILSCIAAIQAPLIMMSQNRQEQKDRKRSENDYMVNLKAEIEIRNLHKKLDLLMLEQMKKLLEVQKIQLEYLEKINTKL